MNPAASFSDNLLKEAFDVSASDIHFYPVLGEAKIYFRVHGKRMFIKKIPVKTYELLLTYYKFISGMDIGETRKPQDGTITHIHYTTPYYLRLSTLPVQRKESLVIRILPQEQQLSLDQLFLFPNQLNKIKKWMDFRSGLILLTGPTGSGKTTTLYALLNAILQEKSYQMITLEDPIEKDIDEILQVQVNEKAGVTYQTGLKAALRHDPDIIMIGEIRDRHTAKFAFEASLTGHLVLSTLHAKNAQGTIHRLLDMGLGQVEIKQTLMAVASIQLLPIQARSMIMRRAAILEFLDGDLLNHAIDHLDTTLNLTESFDHLRKKAYAYGFITKKIFEQL